MKSNFNETIYIITMKNLYKPLLIMFVFCLISFKMSAQTDKDTAAVLLKCIDLPELQKFYPEESDGSLKPICIMQYPVAFSLQQDLNFKGKKALFLTRPMIYEKKIKSFFLFHNLEIIDNKANVTFEFDYYSNSNLNVIKLNAVLLKTGDIWNVTETKNIGR